ncbi:MAG: class I SAM-dependent methyltransferase, partial [Dehalococcoidia bacterium]
LPEAERPDVVLVDPMFPDRRKAARAKKEMQLLQRLLGDDDLDARAVEADTEDLLRAAIECARRRVVVKRPAHAPPVGGRRPDAQVPGRAARYDIYLARSV